MEEGNRELLNYGSKDSDDLKEKKLTKKEMTEELKHVNQELADVKQQLDDALSANESRESEPYHPALDIDQVAKNPSIAFEVGDIPGMPVPMGEKKQFWVGTQPDCPYQNITVGGQSFPRSTQKVTKGRSIGETKRDERRGAVYEWTQDTLEFVCNAIKKRIVRKSPRPAQFSVDDKSYRRHEGDELLAKYLFIVDLSEVKHDWRDQEPEPLVK